MTEDAEPDAHWAPLKSNIHGAALETFGKRKKQDRDWYRYSVHTIRPLLEEKRHALVHYKLRPTRQAKESYRAARSNALATVRKCVQRFWSSLSLFSY